MSPRSFRRYAGVAVPALLASAALVASRRRLASAALLVWCSRRRLGLVFAAWPPRILRVCPRLAAPGGCVGPLVWAHTPRLSQFASVDRLHRAARFIASSYVGRRRPLYCCRVVQVAVLVAPLIRAGVASSPHCSSLTRCVCVSRRLVSARVVWYCLPPSLHCWCIGCSPWLYALSPVGYRLVALAIWCFSLAPRRLLRSLRRTAVYRHAVTGSVSF